MQPTPSLTGAPLPTTGALFLFHTAAEELLGVDLDEQRLGELYRSVLEVVGTVREFEPHAVQAGLVNVQDRVKAITGVELPLDTSTVLVSHALRHTRQGIAGAALTQRASSVGVLHGSRHWEYAAKTGTFRCECIIQSGDAPRPSTFTAAFLPFSVKIDRVFLVAGRAA